MERKRFITPFGRIKFNNLVKPVEDKFPNPQKPNKRTYQVDLLIENNSENKPKLDEIRSYVRASLDEKFGRNFQPLPNNNFIKEGTGEWEGWTILRAKYSGEKDKKPQFRVQNRDGSPGSADQFYAGCWARMQFEPYLYDKMGKGVSSNLLTIQFIDHDSEITSFAPGDTMEAVEHYDRLSREVGDVGDIV